MAMNIPTNKAPASQRAVTPLKPDPPPSTPRCVVEEVPEGMKVTLLIDGVIAKRLKMKAGSMEMYRYLWENIFNRALSDHVY